MQCSRCSYIQFKSSSKCANCGCDFKKQKSNVHAEAENTFTIFATVGAEAGAVSGNASAETAEDFQQESPVTETDGLYDSPSEELTDHNETDVENLRDFELDLSDADGPDSESWDIGATLTGDLSESTSVASEDHLKDEDLEAGEFEVQGLGFDLKADPTDTEETQEADPELDDFFLPEPEPEQILDTDSDEITLETELPIGDTESTESDREQTSQAPVDLEAPEIELNPTIELEELQLNMETDSLKIEPKQADDPSTAPEASLEGLELKMDSDEDAPRPLFPDEESPEEYPKEDN